MRIANSAVEQLLQGTRAAVPKPAADSAKGEDFGATLLDVMKEVNSSQLNARKAQEDVITGKSTDYQDVMISMEKASTAMQLTLSVRNKVLEAYQEINKMQV